MAGSKDSIDRSRDEIDKIVALGHYDEALLAITEFENYFQDQSKEDSLLTSIDVIKIRILKSRILRFKGSLYNSFEIIEGLLQNIYLKENKLIELDAFVENIYVLMRLGRIDEVVKLQSQTTGIFMDLSKQDRITAQNTEGNFYNIKGIIHLHKGDHEKALKYLHKGLIIRKNLGNNMDIAMSMNNIGLTYKSKGNLDEALRNLSVSLELWRGVKNKRLIGMSFNNLGTVYHAKENLDIAVEYLTESLKYREEIGDVQKSAETLYNLILVCLDKESKEGYEEGKTYFEKLSQFNKMDYNKSTDLRARLANALILKASKRVINIADAQKILQEIVKEDVVETSLTITAMIYLTEMLIQEYAFYNHIEVLKKLLDLTNKLYSIAQKNNLPYLIVESLILRSKFAMLDGNLEFCKKILDQAETTTQKYNLPHLKKKIDDELKKLEDNLLKYEEMINKGKSINERMQEIELEEYIKAAKEVTRII